MIQLLLAQCVMCFRTAEAQQGARAQVLDVAILLLGVPPFLILAGYCVLFWKKNEITREDSSSNDVDAELHPGINLTPRRG